MRTHLTGSEGETAAIGRDLGRQLRAGDAVLLEGPLGAGKTAFARGLAEGLGCDPEAVSSPTFTLIQEYAGPTPVQHVDLYRLTERETEELGLDELLETSVLAVEWPDRWRDPPIEAIRVRLAIVSATERRITIARPGDRTPAAAPYSTR